MKKIIFIAYAGLLCMFTSCNNSTPVSSDSSDTGRADVQKNMAASDVVMKAFQTGDANSLDSVIADDFIDHTDMGDKKGKDSLKAMVNMVHTSYPDMKFEKIHDVADSEYVYSWITYSGISDGKMGMPKGPFKMTGIELSKFKDGKAVEHWSFMDSRDVAKMMPQPQPAMNKMDAAKMKK